VSTRDEYLARPLSARLARLARTPDDLAEALRGRPGAALQERPAPSQWSAIDIICHLRDIEELYILRFHLMLASDDPLVFVAGAPPHDPERWGITADVPFPLDPDRWREERQYRRNDPHEALGAFRRRRGEVMALLAGLSAEGWLRGSIHPEHGRITFEDWTAGMAGHDDNHLAQLSAVLAGEASRHFP
jgi:hypothetical protein